jgi:hypothetical protein
MKRLMLALAIAAVVFGGVYGFAASLGVSSKTLGAANTVVAACQSTSLQASYATTYDSTIPGYKVGVVTVTGLDTTSPTNCASKSFKIAIVNASNVSLGEVSGTTPASGTSFTADFTSSNVSAANATGIQVAISG